MTEPVVQLASGRNNVSLHCKGMGIRFERKKVTGQEKGYQPRYSLVLQRNGCTALMMCRWSTDVSPPERKGYYFYDVILCFQGKKLLQKLNIFMFGFFSSPLKIVR